MDSLNLSDTANIITIVAGLIAIAAAIIGVVKWLKPAEPDDKDVPALEGYLKKQRDDYRRGRSDAYIHTIDHLMAALRLPADAIFKTASLSRKIKIKPRRGAKGMADGHLYEYDDKG